MGEKQISGGLEGAPLREYTKALLNDIRALEKMIEDGWFEASSVRRIGAEQEMFLVDEGWRPACRALEVLEAADDPHFTTELALFNLEANLDPLDFGGTAIRRMEDQLEALLGVARAAAAEAGAHVVMAGILPTIRKSDLGMDSMTPYDRYLVLNEVLGKMRGGSYNIQIRGVDELAVKHDNVMVEACNCSFQVHFQVAPDEFARLYNVAQLVAAPVLAAATNAPLLFGRRLWSETRIALFQQAVDTRGSAHHLRERASRVRFGSRWVRESVLEVFREDVARFRSLVGNTVNEDPFESLAKGSAPTLPALRLHTGTVYRWNRACYGVNDGQPHLRIENRVLPSGPTVPDEMANAAFWFGLISALAHEGIDVASVVDFSVAKSNFIQAARNGLAGQFEWLDGSVVPANQLIVDTLIPMAREGLQARDIAKEDIDRYLGILEARVSSLQTGARWQVASLQAMQGHASLSERLGAITAGMIKRQGSGKPVAEWELATMEEAGGWKHNYLRVEQYMTTDLFTVNEDEPIDLVAQLMNWERIRHVPVEDHANRLVGLMSYRQVMRSLADNRRDDPPQPVSAVMKKKLVTVTPETTTLEALRLMHEKKIGCLPVVKNGRLVGIVTERDFMELARDLMTQALADGEADGSDRSA